MNKTAIITGILGQDGSYLAELLLEKGYKVIGLRRRASNPNFENVAHLLDNDRLEIVAGDITDQSFIFSLLIKYKPDELYNLAAQSFVQSSFEQPVHTFHVDTEGVINILEGVRQVCPTCRVYQASTSEMFGSARDESYPTAKNGEVYKTYYYQDENTQFIPQSPYAIAKVAAHHMCRLYRESYGLFVSCGILFNHESPRRGKEFVTRKVTDYVGKFEVWRRSLRSDEKAHTNEQYDNIYTVDLGGITGNEFPKLRLGNLDASRDWGHARDYVEAMHLMLQSEQSDDYVVCTEETHTIKELCEVAFNHIGLDYRDYVVVDPKFIRPAEVTYLRGKSSKIKNLLGWNAKTEFKQLIEEMVDSDIRKHNEAR